MKKAIVIGAGPAGLMAADVLSQAGVSVHVYDAMPSAGRKFLLAGKGGLNLTHSEPAEAFASRFGPRRTVVEPWLQQFGADAVRAWAQALGVGTFVGTSGRVFPKDMKAAPLLRAWLHRLRAGGSSGDSMQAALMLAGQPAQSVLTQPVDPVHPVQFHMRHRWLGWADSVTHSGAGAQGAALSPSHPAQQLRFESAGAEVLDSADVVVLALGGASWPQLGSTGAWVEPLAARGVDVAPLLPANCGFDVASVDVAVAASGLPTTLGHQLGWSPFFAQKFAGLPFKSVAISVNSTNESPSTVTRKGEFVATATGVEGSLIYAASALLRDTIARDGHATFYLDLLPDVPAAKVEAEVRHPRGARSLSSHLKSRLNLDGIKMAVLVEVLGKDGLTDPARLAAAIKHLPITVNRARPVAEAISSAGGVRFDGLDSNLMLQRLPGVFCAGEMLDWEAPTGGYLLTASLSSGRLAGQGAVRYLRRGAGG